MSLQADRFNKDFINPRRIERKRSKQKPRTLKLDLFTFGGTIMVVDFFNTDNEEPKVVVSSTFGFSEGQLIKVLTHYSRRQGFTGYDFN
jgi:hypothetical protein